MNKNTNKNKSISLESTAKTTNEISQTAFSQTNTYIVIKGSLAKGDAVCESEENHIKRILKIQNQQWVPLEEAQQALSDLVIEGSIYNGQLLTKIAEANKILAEKYTGDGNDVFGLIDYRENMLYLLREVLQK